MSEQVNKYPVRKIPKNIRENTIKILQWYYDNFPANIYSDADKALEHEAKHFWVKIVIDKLKDDNEYIKAIDTKAIKAAHEEYLKQNNVEF